MVETGKKYRKLVNGKFMKTVNDQNLVTYFLKVVKVRSSSLEKKMTVTYYNGQNMLKYVPRN